MENCFSMRRRDGKRVLLCVSALLTPHLTTARGLAPIFYTPHEPRHNKEFVFWVATNKNASAFCRASRLPQNHRAAATPSLT